MLKPEEVEQIIDAINKINRYLSDYLDNPYWDTIYNHNAALQRVISADYATNAIRRDIRYIFTYKVIKVPLNIKTASGIDMYIKKYIGGDRRRDEEIFALYSQLSDIGKDDVYVYPDNAGIILEYKGTDDSSYWFDEGFFSTSYSNLYKNLDGVDVTTLTDSNARHDCRMFNRAFKVQDAISNMIYDNAPDNIGSVPCLSVVKNHIMELLLDVEDEVV